MLDFDLAEIYQVETRALNQAVKRNVERFPDDFMFQLTQPEWENLKSHFVISSQHGGRRTITFGYIKKANEQCGGFEVKTFTQSHDRFLIVYQKEIFHLGASLKDLGKKWFAFFKMNEEPVESMMNNIKELI